jgi:hypothetical protein
VSIKNLFSNVREKNASINGPLMCQKAEELAKTMGKEKLSATDGWFNRWKSERILCTSVCVVRKKVPIFLAADEWIKTEWLNIIAEYSPEDTYNEEKTELYFLAMPGHTYLFKNEGAKGLKSSKERVVVT